MISLEAACPALPLRKNSACAVFTEGRLRLGRAYRNHCLSGLIVNVGNISSKALFHGHLPRYRLFENLSCTIEPPDVKQETIQTHSAGLENPKAQGDRFFGSSEWKTLPDIWRTASERFPENIAVVDPHHHPATAMTYAQLRRAILEFAEGLIVSGILPNEKISLFAENSCRWLVADQGIMTAGAIDAVRGTRSSIEELVYIYTHSDSVALVVDNKDLFNKLIPQLETSTVKSVVLLWGEKPQYTGVIDIYTYDEIIAQGQSRCAFLPTSNSVLRSFPNIEPESVATLVYTSGTTGKPKGVMLTHTNLLHQVEHLQQVVDISPGDKFLSLLPPWHMYERSSEYFSFSRGAQQVYTNVKSLKEDLKKYNPDFLLSVPLVFDILYSGVQKQLLSGSYVKKVFVSTLLYISMVYKENKRICEGKDLSQSSLKISMLAAALQCGFSRFIAAVLYPLHKLAKILIYKKIYAAIGIKKAAITGGGSLAPHIDQFFEAIDVTLLNGYGLTETSPVIAARVPAENVLGTVGKPLYATDLKVVDLESGKTVPHGSKGLVQVRGPQVMKGYHKDSLATAKVVDKDGWLDTGDLGWIVPDIAYGPSRACSQMLVLDGRVKDTIVLLSGENIDPTRIEEAALQSRYIQQIIVVGQDQRRLGALIVPNREELQAVHASTGDAMKFIRSDLRKYITNGLTPIGPFILLSEPFTIENGLLTPTMKMRRNAIVEKYDAQINDLFRNQHHHISPSM